MDSQQRQWAADNYFTGGLTYANTRAIIDTSGPGTTDAKLYQGGWYQQDMLYSFPISKLGTYEVHLHFAEIYLGLAGA